MNKQTNIWTISRELPEIPGGPEGQHRVQPSSFPFDITCSASDWENISANSTGWLSRLHHTALLGAKRATCHGVVFWLLVSQKLCNPNPNLWQTMATRQRGGIFSLFGMLVPHIKKAVSPSVKLWWLFYHCYGSITDTIPLGLFWTVYHGIAWQNRKLYGLSLSLNM